MSVSFNTDHTKLVGGPGSLKRPDAPLPLACTLPGRLHVRSYAHGEFKITPMFAAGTTRGGLGGIVRKRTRWTVPVDVGYAARAFLDKWLVASGQLSVEEAFSLDSCSEFQDASKGYPGYGEVCADSKFSAYSRIRVQEAGEVAKRKYGRSGRMITLTCPGSGEEVARAFSAWSGYMVARFRQWLRDCMKCEHAVIGVWEWQKRGMLHLHLAVMCADGAALERLDNGFKRAWANILKCVMRKSGVDVCAASSVYSWLPEGPVSQQDCQPIRKDVSRYLCKYLSKEKMVAAKTTQYCPSRWVTVDRLTSREARMLRSYSVLEGFSIASWQDVCDVIADELAPLMTAGRRFVHPVFASLRGLVAWTDPEKISQLWEAIEDVVVCFDANGARITNPDSTRGN